MSVSREIVAEVHQVPVEKCNCRNCQWSFTIIHNYLRCERWHNTCYSKEFCSFFVKRTPEDEAKDYMKEVK